MDNHFFEFIEQLKQKVGNSLPGENAQFKMAPVARLKLNDFQSQMNQAKLSAILALIYPKNNDIKILLTLRQSYNGTHSNQVSFPGGRFEEKDFNFEYTALRETEEEVGIDKNEINIIGKLSQLYIPASNFLVHPFIGFHNGENLQFKLDPIEVQKVIEFDLKSLKSQEIKKFGRFKTGMGFELEAPYYDIEGEKVWGATAMMLSEIEHLL